ncbi:hypothetical protein MSMTP_0378 [Methanosarcina sp. MTP4]|uniref:hypothetical protein n=1 Tax=Methanosarcina sp. MTP4 TaxID=1434100 RepID=UPI0006160B86|nr:hypothetical protein [Methanosarcina sp. MTP4]AKB23847.1 hypothetical protein MSMTP_0378 [Methanosarcina sp. MTP4]
MEGSKWVMLLIVLFLSGTLLLSLHESGKLPWGADDIDNRGGINRTPASVIMQEICLNDSDFQNLTKGNYTCPVTIFNETGESVRYIRINGWYIHKVTIEMQNGTLKSIETEDTLDDLYKEVDSLNGSVKSVDSKITGGEFYMVTIDTPNGTVKSIEKVDKLPEWALGIAESVAVE